MGFSILTPMCALIGYDYDDVRYTKRYIHQECRFCGWERKLEK